MAGFGVDFSPLGDLYNTYNRARTEKQSQDWLQQQGLPGNLNLAQLALQQQAVQRGQSNADRQFGLQERQFGLAQQQATRREEPEEIRKLRAAGIDPNSPEGRRALFPKAEGTTNITAQVEQRKQAAAGMGLAPDNPAYQSFVLTGKMPREDAQPLTATDKKAILEADEGVLSARQAIEALNKAKQLSPEAMGNPVARRLAPIGAFLGNETSEKTVELDNVVTSNALSQLKAIFGGAPTEGERKILLDIQGSSGMPDAVRQKVFDRAIAMAEARLKFNEQRASEMRGGSFYKAPKAGATLAQPQAAPRLAPDGNHYVPDPGRPGKYLKVIP